MSSLANYEYLVASLRKFVLLVSESMNVIGSDSVNSTFLNFIFKF